MKSDWQYSKPIVGFDSNDLPIFLDSWNNEGVMTTTEKELVELKSLVKQFLEEIMFVPFRAVDCDQDTVEDLWEKLADAVEEKK